MRKSGLILIMMLLAGQVVAFSEPSALQGKKSHKYRTLCSILGAGGGFALGLFGGMAVYDDAINSDRKTWTLAAITGGAGGVGGYLIGRALDGRRKDPQQPITWQLPDPLERNNRILSDPGRGVPPEAKGKIPISLYRGSNKEVRCF